MDELTNEKEKLYIRVYNYYKELIESGQMQPGSRLPSVRQCALLLQISRTTVENAYLQLTADGYIQSKPQSGYYVNSLPIGPENIGHLPMPNDTISINDEHSEALYDFSSRSVDRESFDFNIWRRYIKSALRQDERLLSYGDAQGELELRQAIVDYIAKARNIICRPEQIVIGAGTQSLLQILCPILDSEKTVSFPSNSMKQGISIFENYGYRIHYKDKNAPIIYVSPSHMNKKGDIMPVSRRFELIRYASQRQSLIIEDDYESEFQGTGKPIPALFGITGGKGVVYLGTFSRLLLPSIRISYMILPYNIQKQYLERAAFYNQTASKTEQIALCQFIRDGHMEARLRKLRRLYNSKNRHLYKEACSALERHCKIEEHNLCISITIEKKFTAAIKELEQSKKFHFDHIKEGDSYTEILLSSLTISDYLIHDAIQLLSQSLHLS